MGQPTLKEKIKSIFGSIAWKVFIWSLNTTEDEYWKSIYLQEKMRTDRNYPL